MNRRKIYRSLAVALGASLLMVVAPLKGQSTGSTDVLPASAGFTLRANAKLVVVDVGVEDSQGRPVHGLRRADFLIEESGKPQTLKDFEERSGAKGNGGPPELPAMPTGFFTDYTPVAPDSTLNIVLIDTLNTSMKDQSYVHQQLQQYVKHANLNSRVAIFGLATHLILLQGFTSDPRILRDAVEHRLTSRGSILLNESDGGHADSALTSEAVNSVEANASAVAAVQQFQSQQTDFQDQLRVRYTLDAFGQLARYLANFPGRKNLIWFSGSFSVNFFGDVNGSSPLARQAEFGDDIRETTHLLDQARIAVYPIDARGLQAPPIFEASRSGAGYAGDLRRAGAKIARFNEQNAAEHITMDQIAEDTGGHAFYNTNGLSDAVGKAIDAGASFYTLSYSPSDASRNGGYRSIHVRLQGGLAARGWRLFYRHGYFAEDPNARRSSASLLELPSPSRIGSPGYGELAMRHGAPAPTEIVFKASVLPASANTEDKVAERNVVNPNHPPQGPFRRYRIAYTALGTHFELPAGTDGDRHGAVEFVTYVYDAEGRLINIAGQTFRLNLTAAVYAQLMKTGMSAILQVSAPAQGESFFRIAVHDMTSGRFGVIEVPDSAVKHLPSQ